jgi:hypothetical protein
MSLHYTYLDNRAAITVSGPDRYAFLQGLITNDINKVENGLVYACLLTPQGKFLFDFFVRLENEELILECEGGERAEALLKKLKLYKLHSDVTLDLNDQDVWVLWGDMDLDHPRDPRHLDLGFRSYEKPKQGEEAPFEEWDKRRISLCVPDGSRDLIPEKSTLSEGNMDALNAIDYKKGCYVGQELTARMHYRGLAKKRLYTVSFEGGAPAPMTDLTDNDGKNIGEMRSSQGSTGLALLKIEEAEKPLPFKVL